MFKQSLLSTLAVGLLATAGAASADVITQDIHIVVQVPTADFYVTPNGGWPTAPVPLTYDPANDTFNSYDLTLRVKSTAAPVEASLAYPATVNDVHSTASFPLDVTIGGLSLSSTTPVEIAPLGPNEVTRVLRITSSAMAPAAGDYQGTVALVFDATP